MSKIVPIFLFFFIEEYKFRTTLFVTDIQCLDIVDSVEVQLGRYKKIFCRSDLRFKILMCQLCSLKRFPRKFVTAMHCAPILHTCQESDTKKEWTVRKTYLWFLHISTKKTGNYFFSQKGVELRPLQQLIGYRLYRMIFTVKFRAEFTKPLEKIFLSVSAHAFMFTCCK